MDFDESLASGPHARLAALQGTWAGSNTVWMQPGTPAHEAEISLRAEPVAGGRSLRLAYESTVDEADASGELLLAHDLDAGAWRAAWTDSFHTSTMLMRFDGNAWDDGAAPLLEGSWGPAEQPWGWTITFALDGDELLVAHDIVPPGADPARAIEWRCRRA
jgi:hypothetical protein